MVELTEKEKNTIKRMANDGAKNLPISGHCWISNGEEDEGNYCLVCVKKKVAEFGPDCFFNSGYAPESDSQLFCDTCGVWLDVAYTECLCSDEIEHFMDNGFNPNYSHDCQSLVEIISAQYDGWGFESLCRMILDNNFWIIPDNEYRHMWE